MNRTTVLTLIALSLLFTACGDAAARISSLDVAAAIASCEPVDGPRAFFAFFGGDDVTGSGAALGQAPRGAHIAEATC